jgi:uncharacterized protein
MAPSNSEASQPELSTFLTAEWRNLAMLNYEVDPGFLSNLVPAGTELDCWNGKAFVSMVGFRFLKTKVFGISFPFHRNFDEVNLRFYVRRQHGMEVRRGVVFIREIVPRRLIATVARSFYNERYVVLPMQHQVQADGPDIAVEYRWKFNKRWNTLSLKANGSPVVPGRGSQEEFITEHYWGYVAQNDGGCIEYQVRHPQWKVWAATDARFDGCMEELYGGELGAVLTRLPVSAFYAQGSAVSVHRGRRLQRNV